MPNGTSLIRPRPSRSSGAHLPFHDELPTWAMDAGADVCVVSVHKMGAGFEQGSVFHLQGDIIDPQRLSSCADLLMTTSPSVIVYSALDGWRRQMVQRGHDLLGAALTLCRRLRTEIDAVPGLHVLEDELLGAEASHDLDRMQILVDVSELGVHGYDCADWLRTHRRIDVGMSDHRRILATMSMADDDASAERLLEALVALAATAPSLPSAAAIRLPAPDELALDTVDLPRDAFFGPTETVSFADAAGRIAAEQLIPSPPGIPVVVPGERITEPITEYLRTGIDAGMVVPDAADPELKTIRVSAKT